MPWGSKQVLRTRWSISHSTFGTGPAAFPKMVACCGRRRQQRQRLRARTRNPWRLTPNFECNIGSRAKDSMRATYGGNLIVNNSSCDHSSRFSSLRILTFGPFLSQSLFMFPLGLLPFRVPVQLVYGIRQRYYLNAVPNL